MLLQNLKNIAPTEEEFETCTLRCLVLLPNGVLNTDTMALSCVSRNFSVKVGL